MWMLLDIMLAILLISWVCMFVNGDFPSSTEDVATITGLMGLLTAYLFYHNRTWLGYSYASRSAILHGFFVMLGSAVSYLTLFLIFEAVRTRRYRQELEAKK